jgi:IstB-like ATP binding protein
MTRKGREETRASNRSSAGTTSGTHTPARSSGTAATSWSCRGSLATHSPDITLKAYAHLFNAIQHMQRRTPPGEQARRRLLAASWQQTRPTRRSNKPFSAWGEIFGDDAVATAMIDRLVHHAEILALKGDSYRLRGKDIDARTGAKPLEIA